MSTVKPIVISTWYHGERANETAINILQKGGSALDAVVAGAAVSEEDPNVMDVGLGGLPVKTELLPWMPLLWDRMDVAVRWRGWKGSSMRRQWRKK